MLVLALIWAGGFIIECSIAVFRGQSIGGDGLFFRCAICGLIATLFFAVFHFKRESVRIPASNPGDFLQRLRPMLTELGYRDKGETRGSHTFRPAARSLLFGSSIRVALSDGWATLHGPRVYLEMLRRRLRMQGYVEQAERKIVPVAPSEALSHRVELALHVQPRQWREVQQRVIEVLQQAGADVFCHVNILAQTDYGIPDRIVDGELQEWLRQEEVPAEVRKQPFVAIPGPAVEASLGGPG